MAQDQTSTHGIQLGFLSGAFRDDPGRLALLGVIGQEEISRLFSFTLLLSSPTGALTDEEIRGVVREPCAIALGPRRGDVVHGVLASVEHLDTTRHTDQRYLARMIPQVGLLDMSKRSAIYQATTVPKLAETILSSYGLSKGTHFSILVADEKKSPEHEYIVQYEESDWAFLQRWLEREGFFYWLQHDRTGAKLIIADANDDTTPVEDPAVISYRERNNLETGGEATIWDVRVREARVPNRVVVVDYNNRRPSLMLVAAHDVGTTGFGTRFHYGEHFKDVEVGQGVAKLRAERHLTERRTVSGVTDCARFRVGHSFELENHHHAAYDGRYLITKVTHRAGYDVGVDESLFPGDDAQQLHRYNAAFEAIPLDTPFRPERRTPWPRLSGFIHGHVEADTGGDYAQIDDQGRYKVKLPFDVGTTRGLVASRWIRMAQPYAGAGYGMHFPQHKGTEVLVAHNDGDPDRPVIIAAVPNAETQSPVASRNATQSVIDTASGIRVEFEDLQQ